MEDSVTEKSKFGVDASETEIATERLDISLAAADGSDTDADMHDSRPTLKPETAEDRTKESAWPTRNF
jgi:hypothetical protein